MVPRRVGHDTLLQFLVSQGEHGIAAPRNLNAPTFCRFSHLKKILAPHRWSKYAEVRTGVR